MRWMILAVVAALAVPGVAAAAGRRAPSSVRSLVVDRLRLDAYSPGLVPHTPPLRSSRLAKGKLYVVTVQGTVSFYAAVDYRAIQIPFTRFCGVAQRAPLFASAGGVGPVSNDAEFIFAQPVSGTPCSSLKLPHAYPNLQVDNGFGWGHPRLLSPTRLTRPTANHAYDFAVVGQGRPLQLELVDPDTRDDYGSFQITIRHAIGADCTRGRWRAFALRRAAICTGDTAHTTGTIPKLATPRPLALSQAPLAHVARDSDIATGSNQELPNGALTAPQFARLQASSTAVAASETTLLAGHSFVSGAIAAFAGPTIPTITSTALQFASPAGARAAAAGLVALATGANAPAGSGGTAAPAPGAAQTELITYVPTSAGGPAGLEAIASAGDGVYTLRELQTAGSGPVDATALQALLGQLIAR